PSGLHKGFLEPEHLLVVDGDGRRVGPSTAANRKLKPTSELPMHLEAYRQRPDVEAVVHAHPPTTVALSIAGVSLADCLLPEVIVFLGIIPTTAYATPASEENVRAIRELIANHDALVLQRHGSLTVGDSPMQAFMRLETVEQNSRIAFMLQQLGASHSLPAAEVEKLLRQRQEMGLSRPGEAAEFCDYCGACHLGDEHPATLRPGKVTGRGPSESRHGSPQGLPPVSSPAVGQESVRELVAQVVRQTMGTGS
ncbi:MAG TPA: class II aldolase/adducin family protein, partial [Anaerolineae bacterium]|nr:class II aldolase/adducin family protein [Anaerolineae bacterium]